MKEIKIPIVTFLKEIINNLEYLSETKKEFIVAKDFYYKPTNTYYRKGHTFMFVSTDKY